MKRAREIDDGDDDHAQMESPKVARISDYEDSEKQTPKVASDSAEKSAKDEKSSGDDLVGWPNWYKTATEAEQAFVERVLKPDDKHIVLSEMWPCGECEKWTPHCYIQGPPDKEPTDGSEWLVKYDTDAYPNGQPKLSGRTVACVVCDGFWNHVVPMGSDVTKRHQLVRLWYEPAKKKKEQTVAQVLPTDEKTPAVVPESTSTEPTAISTAPDSSEPAAAAPEPIATETVV